MKRRDAREHHVRRAGPAPRVARVAAARRPRGGGGAARRGARGGPARDDGRIKLAVTAPPVDGEANAAVIELVAEALAVPRRAVEVIAGASSRRKTIRVTGVTAAALGEPGA